MTTTTGKYPEWLRKKAPSQSVFIEMKKLLEGLSLHTVCQSALCPNLGECFSRHTAAFLIMGDICTRNCCFCAIQNGGPSPIDSDEPKNIAKAVRKLKLKHIVITSVTRDDLSDGGASYFAEVVDTVRQNNPQTSIEVLIPDFGGSTDAVKIVVDSSPDVINHNIETVPRLYANVRPQADYHRSLNLLLTAKSMADNILTKSGIMLGLGETRDEVVEVMEDLHTNRCDMLTIGQYLAPSSRHHPVVRYVNPEEFEEYKNLGQERGFVHVNSGPFVRSSFGAAEAFTVSSNISDIK